MSNTGKKVYDLKNLRAAKIGEAEKALAGGDGAAYEAAIADVKNFNMEIEQHEALIAEQGRFNDGDSKFESLAQTQAQKREDDMAKSRLERLTSGNEYVNAFATAMKRGSSPDKRNDEDLAPLYNAMTQGEGDGEAGGFLVPIDVINRIRELRRDFVSLDTLLSHEQVYTSSGSRVIEKEGEVVVATPVSELAPTPTLSGPRFKPIEYKVLTYRKMLEVSNELINDEAAGLMAYLAKYLERIERNTNNAKFISLLSQAKVNEEAIQGFGDLKRVLNTLLDPALSTGATILVNQNGFNYLDQLEDATGRGLLQPDPTNLTRHSILGRRVVAVGNKFMPDAADGATRISIGHFGEFATKFSRVGFNIASTNIGAGAFENFGYQIRLAFRMDQRVVDNEAIVNGLINY